MTPVQHDYTAMIENVKGVVDRTACSTLLNNNANKASERIPVMRDLIAGEVCKHIALKELLPQDVAQAHLEGILHYHDLDYAPLMPSFNCFLLDLKGMLEKGFRMGNADIEQPRSIKTATTLASQVISDCSSNCYGGITIDRMDEILAPYVKKSYNKHLSAGLLWLEGDERRATVYATKMTEKDVYDAFQTLEYQINTLSTANGQTPFVSVGFGLGTSWEARLIQESILKVRIKGLGKSGRTAVFPKLLFTVKKGLNFHPDDPNYDIKRLALECASKRIYPDILNYDKVAEVTGDFKAAMGCRSFLSAKDGQLAGRNNMGVVSINLPRVALDADGDLDIFFELLDERLELCHKALQTRIERLSRVTAEVAPILYTEGACGVRLKPTDKVIDIMKDGRASISLGYIGLHETLQNLGYSSPLKHPAAKVAAKLIMKHLKSRVLEWAEDEGWGYSLYGTPSEALCDRFWRIDKEKYPEEVDDKGYYTNSFHTFVGAECSPFEKIDYESDFPEISSGGFITYVEGPNLSQYLDSLELLWDYTYDKVPYFGYNSPIDYCESCGFQGEAVAAENGFTCPSCGNHDEATLQVTRRVSGYLSSPNARPFIQGKQKEVIARLKHV